MTSFNSITIVSEQSLKISGYEAFTFNDPTVLVFSTISSFISIYVFAKAYFLATVQKRKYSTICYLLINSSFLKYMNNSYYLMDIVFIFLFKDTTFPSKCQISLILPQDISVSKGIMLWINFSIPSAAEKPFSYR